MPVPLTPPGLQSPAALGLPLYQPVGGAQRRCVTRANTAEGGTAGTTVTQGSAGNSGGLSGDFFDIVSIGASATDVFDGTHAAHGSLSYMHATGATSTTSYNSWSTSIGVSGTAYFRLYLFFTANPAANVPVWSAVQGGNQVAFIQVQTNGTVNFRDHNSATILTTVASIPLNAWFRLEGWVFGNLTSGQVSVSLYDGPDSLTATETQTSAATFNTWGAAEAQRFGITKNTANVAAFWLDDPAGSSCGPIGPSVLPLANAPYSLLTPPGFQSPMALGVPLTAPSPAPQAPPVRQATPVTALIPPGMQSPMALSAYLPPGSAQPGPPPPPVTVVPQASAWLTPPGLQSPMSLGLGLYAPPGRAVPPPQPPPPPALIMADDGDAPWHIRSRRRRT